MAIRPGLYNVRMLLGTTGTIDFVVEQPEGTALNLSATYEAANLIVRRSRTNSTVLFTKAVTLDASGTTGRVLATLTPEELATLGRGTFFYIIEVTDETPDPDVKDAFVYGDLRIE